VDSAALEEQQVARREFSAISRVVHPESTPAREHVKVLVAARVIVRRCCAIDAEDAHAGGVFISQIAVQQQCLGRFREAIRDRVDIETAKLRSALLIHDACVLQCSLLLYSLVSMVIQFLSWAPSRRAEDLRFS